MRQTIPGDAAVLRSGSNSIERTGELLLELAVQLERIAADDGSIGDAADTIRGRTREAAGTLRRAEPRYTTTAGAVQEFAVTLADVQSAHRDAVSRHDDARSKVVYYQHEIAEIDARRLRMMMSLPDPEPWVTTIFTGLSGQDAEKAGLRPAAERNMPKTRRKTVRYMLSPVFDSD